LRRLERTLARNFFVSRLGRLLAFAPLGVWTVAHLWHQLAAYDSPQAWRFAVTGHLNVATTVLVFVLVLGPALAHVRLGNRPHVPQPPGGAAGRILQPALPSCSACPRWACCSFLAPTLLALVRARFLHGRPEPFAQISSRFEIGIHTRPP